jgi:hypothetical protein
MERLPVRYSDDEFRVIADFLEQTTRVLTDEAESLNKQLEGLLGTRRLQKLSAGGGRERQGPRRPVSTAGILEDAMITSRDLGQPSP